MGIISKLGILAWTIGTIEFFLICSVLKNIFDLDSAYTTHKEILELTIIPHSITAIIGAITASAIAYYYQRIFRKEEQRKFIINEVHSFNEAVIYSTALFEELISCAGGSLFVVNEKEKNHLLMLKNGVFTNGVLPHIDLETIPSLQRPDHDLFLRKILTCPA